MKTNKSVEDWEKWVRTLANSKNKKDIDLLVVKIRVLLTSHTNTVLQGVVERVEKMNEQNQLTQGILSAMEYRGFYDAGKYLDGDIWKVIKPVLLSHLHSKKEIIKKQ